MFGYRKQGNGYIIVELELDKDGNPILDNDTTMEEPSFEQRDGFRQTIVNGRWEWVETTVPYSENIEDFRKDAIWKFEQWEPKYLNAPFISGNEVFSGDSTFREMLNSSIMANREWGVLPEFWFTATQKLITPITKDFLDAIGKDSYVCYQDKLKVSISLLGQIKVTQDIDFLKNLVFPEVPTVESQLLEIEKKKVE